MSNVRHIRCIDVRHEAVSRTSLLITNCDDDDDFVITDSTESKKGKRMRGKRSSENSECYWGARVVGGGRVMNVCVLCSTTTSYQCQCQCQQRCDGVICDGVLPVMFCSLLLSVSHTQ